MLKRLSGLIVLFIFILSGCTESGVNECRVSDGEAHVENSVKTESWYDQNNDFKKVGYKHVNFNLLSNEDENEVCVEYYAVIDYYSNDHEYQKSEVRYEFSSTDKLTNREDQDQQIEEIDGPVTILIPDHVKRTDYFPKLSDKEQDRVKTFVNEMVKKHLN